MLRMIGPVYPVMIRGLLLPLELIYAFFFFDDVRYTVARLGVVEANPVSDLPSIAEFKVHTFTIY